MISVLQEKTFEGLYSFSRVLPAVVIGVYIFNLQFFIYGIALGYLDPTIWAAVGPFFKWGTSSFLSLIPLVFKYRNGKS